VELFCVIQFMFLFKADEDLTYNGAVEGRLQEIVDSGRSDHRAFDSPHTLLEIAALLHR
jgi:hypothetical protein